ncbi:hypothetical protein C8Q80DRAFT_1163356 [Daedaleopsis nitida]|nr:hypothetical protein C8Q80DRAFT_1163356 [Daedaleopsis nitida]
MPNATPQRPDSRVPSLDGRSSPRRLQLDQCLPLERQMDILGSLDGNDLLACRQVCRIWRSLIEDCAFFQYKIRLAFAGMRDGPQAPVLGQSLNWVERLAERSDALKADEAAWATNALPQRVLSVPSEWTSVMSDSAVDVLAYYHDNDPHVLILHRPGSFFSGVTEQTWRVNVQAHFDHVEEIRCFALDVVQDLLVLTKDTLMTWHTQTGITECCILSLSQSSRVASTHPSARRATIRATNPNVYDPDYDEEREFPTVCNELGSIAVVGDLIEWTLFNLTLSSDMFVYNWKTGEVIWRIPHFPDGTNKLCRILDPYHVLLVTADRIYVDDMDPDVPMSNLDDSRTRKELQLPRMSEEHSLALIHGHLKRPTASPPSSSTSPGGTHLPHFEPDPDLTMLVVESCVWPNGTQIMLVAIPLSTIRAAVRDCAAKGRRTLAWDEWADRGTGARVLLTRHRRDPVSDRRFPKVYVMGSRVVLDFKSARESAGWTLNPVNHITHDILFFDMHPHCARFRSNDSVMGEVWDLLVPPAAGLERNPDMDVAMHRCGAQEEVLEDEDEDEDGEDANEEDQQDEEEESEDEGQHEEHEDDLKPKHANGETDLMARSDWYTTNQTRIFAQPVRSTLPYRVLAKVRIGENGEYQGWTGHNYPVQDGVLQVDR